MESCSLDSNQNNHLIQIVIKAFRKILVLFAFVIFVLVSCQKEQTNTSQTPTDAIQSNSVLGKKLENPYSVSNMQKAWDNLYGEQNSKETISASHNYIKFFPRDEDDLSLLHNDTLLELYQYPLDYEIFEGSTTYQDPETPEGTPTPLYASVPIVYEIPSVDYEVLEELFIPEELANNNGKFRYEELLREAYRITNNVYDDGIIKSEWTPSGYVKVYDSNKGSFVPVSGAKVRARRWFTTHYGITGTNGNFTCDGSFNGQVNYSLAFERYDFEIRDGWLSTATINGPKKEGTWNLQIYDTEPRFWATIFRAASHYYFGNIHSLRRPPQNSFWNTQLKIRAHYENSENYEGYHSPALRFLGLGSAIHIYNPERSSCDIYGTTIHELAHASHWNMSSGGDYTYCDDIVAESWARGVQWELTRMVYAGYKPVYARGNYTGVVQDMIDGFGTKGTSRWWDSTNDNWGSPYIYLSYNDQVTGYSIKQIEDALLGQRTWNGWKDNIKNLYNNETENKLDATFDYWNTL